MDLEEGESYCLLIVCSSQNGLMAVLKSTYNEKLNLRMVICQFALVEAGVVDDHV